MDPRAHLEETAETLKIYIDPAHHTYVDLYLSRADAKWALGMAPDGILEELWGAARCYAAHAPMYLTKWPRTRFKSRRLVPLELAVVTGDEDVIKDVAQTVATDPMMVIASMADAEVTEELGVLTGWFGSHEITGPADLAGFLAAMHWLALSALVRAEASTLKAVAVTTQEVVAAHRDLASDDATGALGRFLAVADGTAILASVGKDDSLVPALARYGRAAGATDKLDLTPLALMAAAVWTQKTIAGAIESAGDSSELAVPRAFAALLGA